MLNSIRQKVVFSGIAVLALGAASAGCGLWVAATLTDALHRSSVSSTLLRKHLHADMMHDALRSDVLSVLASADPEMGINLADATKDLTEHEKEFRDALRASRELAVDPSIQQALDALAPPLDDYIRLATEIGRLEATDPAAAKARLPAFKQSFDTLEVAMAAASDKIETAASADAAAAERQSLVGKSLMAGSVAVAILFGIGLVILALRSVVRPINDLAEEMGHLADGDIDRELKSAERRDEVGDIGRAVRRFQEMIVAKAAAEADERRRLAEMEAESSVNAERRAREQALRDVVERLADGLHRLSAGELDFRLEQTFDGDYERLRVSTTPSQRWKTRCAPSWTPLRRSVRVPARSAPPPATCRDAPNSRRPTSSRRRLPWTRSPPRSQRRPRAPGAPRRSSRLRSPTPRTPASSSAKRFRP